jgi:outer membrane receptor protein involved in Fe transport
MRFQRNHCRARIYSTVSAVALSVPAVISAGAASPAFAQEAAQGNRVVVTGSRIQRQDFTANSPIVTVDEATFEDTSTIGIETVLNQLPQFVPGLTEFTTGAVESSARSTPGASTVNLRGLGSQRNLVLIDGRRAMPVNATMAVDTNTIPSSAIQRVEIISGGASAVYGADAVGGVVNFILKDEYEGIDVTTRYSMTEAGDGEQFTISALLGANVANGRGNVMIGAEHSSRSIADNLKRDYNLDEANSPFISPSETRLTETYVQFPSSGRPSAAAVSAIFNNPPPCFLPNGTGNPCLPVNNASTFFINPTPDGTGTLFTGGSVGGNNGQQGSYRYAGGFDNPEFPGLPYRKQMADGSIGQNNLRTYTSLPLQRYSMFGKGELEVAPDVSLYVQGNFARTQTDTLLQFSPATGNWAATIPVGNTIYAPSLAASAVTGYNPTTGAPIYNANAPTLPAYTAGGVYGLNCPALGGCTESQAFPLPPELVTLLNSRSPATRNDDINLQRNLDFLPPRQTHNRSTNFQIVAGLEGVLPNDWLWDVSVSHGQSETVAVFEGFVSLERYRAIAESPNFGRAFVQQGNPPSGFGSGTGQCTTGLALVADFEVSQDCIDSLSATMQNTNLMEQNVVEANLTGDMFELPAGTIGFALGASYRENNYDYVTDMLNNVDAFLDQPIGLFAAGSSSGQIDVGEVYGELLVPVLADLPGIQQLNLELGGRYSDYSSIGGEATYKALLDWTVTDWARLRGGYNRATRAPNISELFLARTQNAFGTPAQFGDPCSQRNTEPDYGANPASNPGGAAQSLAICRELMGPTGAFNYYDNRPLEDQPGDGGGNLGSPYTRGNPNVGPETADTWTAGLVLTSPLENPWLSGLNVTIDYYQIKIDGIIASQGPDTIYRDCMLSGSAASPECELIRRDPITGGGATVDLTFTNEGNVKFSGIDVQLNWRAQFEDIGVAFLPGGLSINSQMTFPIKRETQVNDLSPVTDWTGTQGCALGLSCSGYDYSVFTTFNYFVGAFNASLRWNHYPSIDSGAAATNPDTRSRGVHSSYNVFSLSGSYRLNDMLTVRAGVDNLLDNDPPLSGGSFAEDGGYTSDTPPSLPLLPTHAGGVYDQLGRRYFMGLTATF